MQDIKKAISVNFPSQFDYSKTMFRRPRNHFIIHGRNIASMAMAVLHVIKYKQKRHLHQRHHKSRSLKSDFEKYFTVLVIVVNFE